MKDIERTLIQNLRFGDKKAKVYLALLELGQASVSAIATASKLKRTTVYNILPELIQDGHVSISISNKKRNYCIENPKSLKRKVEQDMLVIDNLLPSLKNIQGAIPNRPKITMYEGLGGMRDIYEDFLSEAKSGDIIRAYAGTTNVFEYISEQFLEDYAKKRFDKRIRLQLILNDTKALKSKLETNMLREVKICDKFAFSGETIIYGNKVAFISYKENFLGIVIASKEISKMNKVVFEQLWETI